MSLDKKIETTCQIVMGGGVTYIGIHLTQDKNPDIIQTAIQQTNLNTLANIWKKNIRSNYNISRNRNNGISIIQTKKINLTNNIL
jgi:hypothetical protein